MIIRDEAVTIHSFPFGALFGLSSYTMLGSSDRGNRGV